MKWGVIIIIIAVAVLIGGAYIFFTPNNLFKTSTIEPNILEGQSSYDLTSIADPTIKVTNGTEKIINSWKYKNESGMILGSPVYHTCNWYDDSSAKKDLKHCEVYVEVENQLATKLNITSPNITFIGIEKYSPTYEFSNTYSFYNETRRKTIYNESGRTLIKNITERKRWEKYVKMPSQIPTSKVFSIRASFDMPKYQEAQFDAQVLGSLELSNTKLTLDPNVTACGTLNIAGGNYTLNQSLLATSGDCILIMNDSITFDMNGFNITNSQNNPDAGAIFIESGLQGGTMDNVVIKNGYIYGFNNQSGDYNLAIDSDQNVNNLTIKNMTLKDNWDGIYLYGTINSNFSDIKIIYTTYDAGAPDAGIWIDAGGGFGTSLNNTFYNINISGYGSGFYLDNSVLGSNINNKFYNIEINNTDYGIWLLNGISAQTFNNIKIINSSQKAIALDDTSYNNFSNFNITQSTEGISFFGVGGNNRFENFSIDNSGVGSGVNIFAYSNGYGFTNDNNYFKNGNINAISNIVLNTLTSSARTYNNTFLNVSYSSESFSGGANNISMYRQWYYRAYVNDTLGNPVAGANLTAYNRTGAYQFNLTTNSSGWTDMVVIYDYLAYNYNDVFNWSYYSPYNISVINSSYVSYLNTTYNVTSQTNNYKHVITLSLLPDNEYPIFSNFIEYPSDPATYSSTLKVNLSTNILSSNGTAKIEFNGTNYTMLNNSANTYNYSLSGLSAGFYNYYFLSWGNGTSKNYNITQIYNYTINKAQSVTSLTFDKTSPQVYGTSITPTCSLTTGVGSVLLTNGTSGVPEILGAGTWNFNCSYAGNTNYTSSSNFSTFTITQATNTGTLLLNNTAGNITISYPSQVNVSFTNSSFANLTRNGLDITNLNNQYQNLAVGDYNFTLYIAGNTNYTALSITRFAHITKGTQIANLSINETSPINYPRLINVTCNGVLKRDNIDVSSEIGITKLLGAGNYNYSCQLAESQNYSYDDDNLTFVVNPRVQSITPLLNSGSVNLTLIYPQQVNASYSGTNYTAVTIKVNDVIKNIAQNYTYAVGSYDVNYSIISDQNNSAFETHLNFTMNRANSNVTLYLNNSQGNVSIDNETSVSINATLITGELGTILVYSNGNLINNGTGSRYNLSSFAVPNSYNITAYYIQSENYSASSSLTWYVDVYAKDYIPPTLNITYPLNQSYNSNRTELNYTIDNTAINCWYSLNLGATNVSITCGNNVTGISSQEGSNTWKVYSNDSFGNLNTSVITFFVNTTDVLYPIFTNIIEFPSDPATYSTTLKVNLSTDILNSNGTAFLEFDGVNYTLFNETASTYNYSLSGLSAGTYNYYFLSWGNGTTNNYNTTEVYTYTINKATQTITPLLNGGSDNLTIEYPYQFNVSYSGTNYTPVTISVNNVVKTAGLNYTYSAGSYVVNYSVASNTNYSGYETYLNFTLNKNSSLVLAISGTTPIDYGTTTDVAGSGCPSELTCTLDYANAVYGVGTKTFNYSTAGNENYTATSIIKDIVINKISSNVTLYLNHTQSNVTIDNETSVAINASLITGDATGTILVYSNGILINNGTGNRYNFTSFPTPASYNITAYYQSSENYTTNASLTWYVDVYAKVYPDNEYPVFSNYWDDNGTIVTSGNAHFNVSILSSNGTAFIDIDGTNYSLSNTTLSSYNVTIPLTTGVYPYYFGSWGNGTSHNYNTSKVYYYTINTTPSGTPPTISISYPSNTTYAYNISWFNVTFTNSSSSTCKFSINGTANQSFSCRNNIGGAFNTSNGASNLWVYITDNIGQNDSDFVYWFINDTVVTPPAATCTSKFIKKDLGSEESPYVALCYGIQFN